MYQLCQLYWCWSFLPQSECHPDTCTQMTATEQWIFLCAAHKTPKEVSQEWYSQVSLLFCFLSIIDDPLLYVWTPVLNLSLLFLFCCSALPLITPGTRWTELPVFSIATNTSPAGISLCHPGFSGHYKCNRGSPDCFFPFSTNLFTTDLVLSDFYFFQGEHQGVVSGQAGLCLSSHL